MSSHHIVRDDQEPALIIANGAACNNELLGQLLEWSPLVVVLDAAIKRVTALNIKVDVLLGDFDNGFDPHEFAREQQPVEIVFAPNQEKTDLEKALDYLIDRGIPAVNVIWATGRRADHTLANLTNLARYRDKIKIVILDDNSKVYLLPRSFSKWYPAGTIISLIPIGTVDGITSRNLKYELTADSLTMGYRIGNSNSVAQDGLVEITHSDGDLLLMECYD